MRFSENNPVTDAPHCVLAWQFIIDFITRKGYSLEKLQELPYTDQRELMTDANLYASLKLAEIEARSKLRHKIHTI